MFVKIKMIL